MIGVKLVGDWKMAKRVLETAPAAFDRALKATIGAEAERIAGGIRKKIYSNIKPPNQPSTITLKGSSKTLVASGGMAQSVQLVWKGKFQVFIGIPAQAKKGVARLADINEHGRVIVQHMTDKQRKFLHAKFPSYSGGTGTGIVVIHVPARPFIKPVFEEYEQAGKPKFLKALGENLEAWAHGGG